MKPVYVFLIIGAFLLGVSSSWDYIESAIPPTPAWRFFEFNDTVNDVVNHTATSYRGLFEWESDGSILFEINGTQIGTYNTTSAEYLQEYDVTPEGIIPMDISIKDDGTYTFILGDTDERIESYNMTTPWDITTLDHTTEYNIMSDGFSAPSGLFTRQDGLRLYLTDGMDDNVAQYHLTDAWNITSAVLIQTESVVTNSPAPQTVFFKPDGTKMYILSANAGNIAEYDVGTAWDVSTISYLQEYDITGLDAFGTDMHISPDGRWMTMMSWGGVDFIELATPWDITSAIPRNTLSLTSQDSVHRGFTLGIDGAKMYAAGASDTAVEEYDLETQLYVAPEARDIVTLQVNTPTDSRLGGVYAQECDFNNSFVMTGINSDGTIKCEQLP